MAEDPPMHVYPNPDGTNSATTVPSNTILDATSLASGAIAVGIAVAGSGTATEPALLFLQSAGRSGGFLSIGAASSGYVAAFIFFGSLSVVLGTINLLMGIRTKERLRNFSRRVYQLCEKSGLLKNPV
jgi:hypothetical protein